MADPAPTVDAVPIDAVLIDALTHRYGTFLALDWVTFGIGNGQLFGLLGPNGSGKTTIFRILSTLIRPSAGSATVFGHDPSHEPARVRPLLGVVFQDPALDGELTVRENLSFHGRLYGLGTAPLRTRIDELAELFELSDRLGERVSRLSGGQRRRADLIRGMLHRPRLLLLDEPTTGLDPLARRTFWDVVHRVRRREGVTTIVATHLLDEAEACDDLAILNRGRLIASGSPAALKARLGTEMLWLTADEPDTLRQALHERFGFDAERIGDSVRLADPAAIAQLPAIYQALGSMLTSATVRKPTLEDVFMVLSGQPMAEAEGGLPPAIDA